MGKQKKKQKKRGNPLWTLVFLAALAVFCFSGYKLIGIYLDYKTGTDEYRDLQQYTTEMPFWQDLANRSALSSQLSQASPAAIWFPARPRLISS